MQPSLPEQEDPALLMEKTVLQRQPEPDDAALVATDVKKNAQELFDTNGTKPKEKEHAMEHLMEHPLIGRMFQVGDRRARVVQQLGKGGFGQTFLLQYLDHNFQKTAECVVMKMMHLTKSDKTPARAPFDPNTEKGLDEHSQMLNQIERERDVLEARGELAAPWLREGNTVCLFMRYHPGKTLNDTIHDAPEQCLPPHDAIAIVLDIAKDLQSTYEKTGWFHFDIKDSNVIIGQDGKTHLIDWGAAQAERWSAQQDKHLEDVTEQTYSSVIKTPAAAPPETFASDDANMQTSQVYALGLLLLRMISGQDATLTGMRGLPIARTALEIIARHEYRDPRQALNSSGLWGLLNNRPLGESHETFMDLIAGKCDERTARLLRTYMRSILHPDPKKRMTLPQFILAMEDIRTQTSALRKAA